ncbi:Hypothetical predicted protein, partial [Paramuricea clavata]
MTIRVTNAKKERIKTFLIAAIENPIDISIRQVAKIIGYLVSTLPGVQYGALYYRYLEMDKVSALKISKGNFDAPMTISKDGLVELRWWVNHIDESFNYLMIPPIDITIYSDASLQGWGAVLGREENNSGACPGNFSCPRLAHPALVSTVGPASCSTSSGSGTQSHTADPLSLSENNSSPLQKAETFSMSCLRRQLQQRGYSLRSIEIIESSWRDSTKSQYQVHLQKWLQFCMERDCDIISPNLPQALDFLSSLFDSGLSYSSLNSVRCAVSTILQLSDSAVTFGQLPIVKRFMKGIFELRPALPRYQTTWDVSKVLDFFRKQSMPSALTLKDLTVKVTFLLSLLSGQRCQTIHVLTVDNMILMADKCTFHVREKVKQTRVGTHVKPLEFLCVVTHLLEYVKRTACTRNDTKQLLFSH